MPEPARPVTVAVTRAEAPEWLQALVAHAGGQLSEGPVVVPLHIGGRGWGKAAHWRDGIAARQRQLGLPETGAWDDALDRAHLAAGGGVVRAADGRVSAWWTR